MECAAKGSDSPCSPGPPRRRCGLCGAVAYCSLSHQKSHWNNHKEECGRLEQQMKHAEILNDFPFTFSVKTTLEETRCSFLASKGLHHKGLWGSECSCGPSVVSSNISWIIDDWNLPNALCPCTEPSDPLSTCLTSWKEYYQWRRLPFHSPVALLLHWPLTIYHCFKLSSVHSSIVDDSDKLHIHYLGPDKELLQLAVFGELRALFHGVKLHMELIGPAVPQFRDGETINLCRYTCCSEDNCSCKFSHTNLSDSTRPDSRFSTLSLKLHKGYYHDRHSDIVKDSYPQLIIAPNAGIAAYPSWLPTIKLIKEMGVPAIFTDFCEEAAHLAASCISSVTCQPLKLPVQVNPFRQPMVVDGCPLHLPCYSNCFIFGI